MNREQAKVLLPFIQAFAEGKEVQTKKGDGSWYSPANLAFDGKPENYRIKPEPRTRYVIEHGNTLWGTYTDKEYAQRSLDMAKNYDERYALVEYRTVIEE